MKKIVLLLFMFLVGCQEYEPQTHYVSTIIDGTETDSYLPRAKEILSYVENTNTSDGLELSLQYVGDTRYADTYQFILPKGATGWLSNEDSRRTKRRMLLTQFKDSLSTYRNKLSLRSEIFRLVANEANRLSKIGCNASLLVFSDLKEHSSLYSVYDGKQLQKLYTSPTKVAESFSKMLSERDLKGITIYILHSPKLKDDKLFTAMVAIYKQVFESRGAKVKVTKTYNVTI